MHISRSEIVF